MEFTEVQELDYILAQSMSRNGLLNDTQEQRKSLKIKKANLEQRSYEIPQSDKPNSSSQVSVQSQVEGEGEESAEQLLQAINHLVSSRIEDQKRKMEEAEQYHQQLKLEERKSSEQKTSSSALMAKSQHSKEETEKDEEEEEEEDEEDEEEDEYDEEEEEKRKAERMSRGEKHDEGGETSENSDKFQEVPQEQIIQSFNNVVLKQISMLKSSVKTKENIRMTTYDNPRAKKIEVYFFGTPFNLKIGADDQTTVQEFIKIIIECYLQDPNSDKSLMRFSQYPQAYELRIKDDESFKPESNFPPLDLKRQVQSMFVDAIVLMEVDKFKPPAASVEEQVQQKVREISSQRGLEVLTIELIETGISTMIQINRESTVRDMVQYLVEKKNQRINLKECLVMCREPSDEKYYEVDLMTPIQSLSSTKLRIKRKEWADTPRLVQNSVQYAADLPGEMMTSEPISNMNLVKYEEFNVVKVNDKGRKQKRVLGIDQHKISNINRRIQAQSIGFLDRIFADPVTGTKNPSRQIEHILQISESDGNTVLMRVKDPEHGYEKTLRYIVDNQDERKRLIKKVEGLMDLLKKENQRKSNNTYSTNYSQTLR